MKKVRGPARDPRDWYLPKNELYNLDHQGYILYALGLNSRRHGQNTQQAHRTYTTSLPKASNSPTIQARLATSTLVFRYLDLPAELQLRVLSCALFQPAPIPITPFGDADKLTREERDAALPPLSRVCSSIRHDAQKLHYANDFRGDCTWGVDSRNAEEADNHFLLRRWLQLVPRGRILSLKLTVVCEETRDYSKWQKRVSGWRWASVIASFTTVAELKPAIFPIIHEGSAPEYSVVYYVMTEEHPFVSLP
ncbi:hypothetical protein LTR95_002541 [Oleoguttula sp. CCFEE 5521]